MDKLIINGPVKLSGNVDISSSKNASLPILAATILYPGRICFDRLPQLSDINFFGKILESLGAQVEKKTEKNKLLTCIDCSKLTQTRADYELVRKMRASVLVLGPLLSRFGEAVVSLPGGCAIGTRPVDIHLKGLEEMGAKIDISKGYIHAHCERLQGTRINLAFPSVGATENLMMAAVYAKGTTVIDNAAQEPEIEDLANFLMNMGVEITGAGTSTINIVGNEVGSLKNTEIAYRVIGDRIEAATFIIAGLMCNSEVTVKDFNPVHLQAVLDTLKDMGAKLEVGKDYVKTFASVQLNGTKVETAPFPGFPTDVQAQLMSLMGVSNGTSVISEKIFENRFMHVPELVRMGMDIELDGHTAVITGNAGDITGAPVMCTDLRASAALILAAMVAEGESVINRIYHLDRGYEHIEKKLQQLGAKIERVK
jgi:UDP-N-acetylglucosamine 1-carboxyvinyltransferase